MSAEPGKSLSTELGDIRLDVEMSRPQLAALPPRELWDIAETAGQIAEVAWTVADDQLRRWVEEGQTQAWIAMKVGRTQQAVSKRCARLGIESQSNRGRPKRITTGGNSDEPDPLPDDEPEDEEAVEGEVVEEGGEPWRGHRLNMHEQGEKPARRVRCPTCHQLADPADLPAHRPRCSCDQPADLDERGRCTRCWGWPG